MFHTAWCTRNAYNSRVSFWITLKNSPQNCLTNTVPSCWMCDTVNETGVICDQRLSVGIRSNLSFICVWWSWLETCHDRHRASVPWAILHPGSTQGERFQGQTIQGRTGHSVNFLSVSLQGSVIAQSMSGVWTHVNVYILRNQHSCAQRSRHEVKVIKKTGEWWLKGEHLVILVRWTK